MIGSEDYEGRVSGYALELIEQLSAFSGNTMNVSAWFNYWSFDAMGDLNFEKSFNMLKTSASTSEPCRMRCT